MTTNANIDYRRCAFAHAASLMFEEYTELQITPKKMSEIIGTQMDDEVEDFLYDPNDSFMDTCVREEVLDIISRHYVEHPWPRYLENVDMTVFAENLEEAIENET